MTSSKAFAFALLASFVVAGTGCSTFDSEDSGNGEPQVPGRENGDPKAADAPKAPPVGGPADTSELTNELGVFVAPSGAADAPGTREHPLASIQPAIDLAKRVGKRVYVCSGTFHESLTIADSISMIGGLDCTRNEWRTAATPTTRTRIEAPTSPALRATNIKSPTRLEGLELVAPSATAPSSSSIGLIAEHASALVIARTKITAGDGANGTDGTDGIQLTTSATANGAQTSAMRQCDNTTCPYGKFATVANPMWLRLPGPAGGTNVCAGAPGHDAQPGGAGGSGGIWQAVAPDGVSYVWQPYENNALAANATGDKSRTSAAGTDGADGSNGPAGEISRDGYVAANGTVGKDGAPGAGGVGGNGLVPTLAASTVGASTVWRGLSGASGGAGGCPGLAGTPGSGGGASIAALLSDSPVAFDGTELVSGRGGNGGHGTFGSTPLAGGQPGNVADPVAFAAAVAKAGGRGGAAGVSGNGSPGPSLGIAHTGAAPMVTGGSKITPGAAGSAIPARSRTDSFGITKTIPAMAAGISKAVLAH